MFDESVLWQVSYGLYSINVNDNGRATGCIANAAMQITSENPIFALSINKNNYTYEVIARTRRFAMSIISEETSPKAIGALGYASGRDTDKFASVSYEMVDDLPILKEHCTGHILFDVLDMMEVETHVIITARVKSAFQDAPATPMTYKYFHQVVKGKAPKNAPTYQKPSQPKETVQYVCTVCGYIYEGDITKEPDSYVCPICGAGKDKFVLKS